ncbi:MAG TPA: hypothetical protein VEC01_11265 [Noviherbaspirillum sp.]|uniref:hypothetical protein n=1 Tax=Noviherbaspirillum sp. TaxID=1926288 RepID=UPI002D25A752|nr:hypothetical protein [Noviherbaspirillum sp.]HYD95896.1 hypothetical protein [Noviherbaspirillum sp.]
MSPANAGKSFSIEHRFSSLFAKRHSEIASLHRERCQPRHFFAPECDNQLQEENKKPGSCRPDIAKFPWATDIAYGRRAA